MTLETRRERRATLMLLAACVVWGMGFNWNKEGQAILSERLASIAENPDVHGLGPAWFLAIRFFLASACWALVFPSSRKSWNASTLWGGLWGGLFLAGGMLFQHYGLAETSESLSSFLTSLTVLFTPFMAVFLFKQRISVWVWVAVGCAAVGVTLMAFGREEASFDGGVLLGLLCAVAFSAHILVIDRYGKRESPWRLCLSQMTAASIIFVLFALVWGAMHVPVSVSTVSRAAWDDSFLLRLLLTTGPGTLLTFGLMFRYQPDTSATRAALAYQSEAIIATVYPWIIAGTAITGLAIAGAGLIFLGNILVELLGRRSNDEPSKSTSQTVVGPVLD